MRFNQGNKQVTNIMGPKGRGQELILLEGLHQTQLRVVREGREENSLSGLPCLDCLASEAGRKTTPSGQNCQSSTLANTGQ